MSVTPLVVKFAAKTGVEGLLDYPTASVPPDSTSSPPLVPRDHSHTGLVMQVVIIFGSLGVLLVGRGLFGLMLLVALKTLLDLY